MGKSAILATWLARREAAGEVVPHHFVRRQVADWDQPEAIAASLAAQLEAAYPALRDPEAKPERRLLELLGRVSKQLHPSRRMVIVVDGLDEARAEPGDNPLPRFLPHLVPAGIRFLCATRPTFPHLSWIEARGPVRRVGLDDSRWTASNDAVVRGFWEAAACEFQPPLPAEMIAAAITHADGNVLHAVLLHDAWRDLPAPERRADRIPRGLKALIGEIWDRAASHESVRVGLGLLCAAQEALSLDVLAELAGWGYDDKERFAHDARQLLLEEPASWAGAEAYRPRHDWVRELIAARLGAPTMRAHHETLSRELATWPPPSEARRRTYAVCHALAHRIAVDDWSGVHEVALDLGYLEARAHATDVSALEQELTDARTRCPDPAVARDLADLARALARESHWMHVEPKGAAGLIWNRLRRWGWTAKDLDALLPVDAAFLRVRHAPSRESSSIERTLDGHVSVVRSCAIADGHRMVSASDDRTLKIWDLDAGRLLTTLVGHTDAVNACVATPDGRRVVSASDDRTLKIWDLDAGRLLATLEGHTDTVNACAVTPDGRRVVSASDDRTLKIWDLDVGCVSTLRGHDDVVNACAVTPDGRRVISGSSDRTLKVWDLDAGRLLTSFDRHSRVVNACTVMPDGRVISASWDRSLRVWDPDTGRTLATFRGHAGGVLACAVTRDGRRLVSASSDRTLMVWSLDADLTLDTFDGHYSGVLACAVTPNGRRVVSASRDGTLRVWDRTSGRVLATFGHRFGVNACAVTSDGRRLVSACRNALMVWDLDAGRIVATLEGHAASVSSCAITPDDRHVVSSSDDCTVRVWDLDGGSLLTTLYGHVRSVNACAVTPDGRRAISASDDRTLKIWDLGTGRTIATLDGHIGGVLACAVTPDGLRAISASNDDTLKVWDLDARRVLSHLEGHARAVTACAITPDGRHAISASYDRTLKVWDLASASCLVTHRGDAAFRCVAATGDGIIAGDSMGTVWFLDGPQSSAPRQPRSRKARPRRIEATSARWQRRR